MRNWLKVLRLDQDKTQAQIAKEIKISRAYYTEIENGIKTPSPNVAQRIGDILGFKWTRFFEETEQIGA